jgi:hypothetical protein
MLLAFGWQIAGAQDHRLYWKYKDYDGAIPVTAPRWLIHAGSWFAPEKADRKMIRKVRKARVLAFDGQSPVTTADYKRFERRAKRRNLEDLLFVREGDTRVRIMVKERRAILRKVVVFVHSPEEFVLVSVRGKLRLNEIGKALERFSKEEGDKPLIPPVLKTPVEKV